jgi:light-regulated signal transduction histidine kinase (bacteriophytochrome)
MSNNGFNVLIIDDEEVDRLLARRCLTREGQVSNVVEASSLEEGLKVAAENEIDVVLLDLSLGRTTGLETLHEFQRQLSTNYPIVLLSGLSDQALAMKAVEDGAEDFINKDAIKHQWLSISLQNAIKRHQQKERILHDARELQLANSDLRQFNYVASHDLQEPLRAVLGYGRMLRKRAESRLDDEEKEWLRHIEEGSARMQRLIEDLLAFSHHSLVVSDFSEVDLNKCMNEACESLQTSIQENKAEIYLDPLPTIMGNASQLARLFQNVVGNALKYRSTDSPIVKVTCIESDDQVEIRISDNGIGIDAGYHEQIFGLFKRLHRREEYPGTGIGLAICLKIVERHNGTMRVESEFGEGTTFVVSLPKRIGYKNPG